jgi:hypothetical protein
MKLVGHQLRQMLAIAKTIPRTIYLPAIPRVPCRTGIGRCADGLECPKELLAYANVILEEITLGLLSVAGGQGYTSSSCFIRTSWLRKYRMPDHELKSSMHELAVSGALVCEPRGKVLVGGFVLDEDLALE